MTDFWWFPLALVVMACLALTVVAGLAGALFRRLPAQSGSMVGGALAVLAVVYVIGGIGLALVIGEPTIAGADVDCPGPPYSTC